MIRQLLTATSAFTVLAVGLLHSTFSSADVKSYIPSKTIYALHHLYEGFKIDEKTDTVETTGFSFFPDVNTAGQAIFKRKARGAKFTIPLADFEFERRLAPSVFEATTGTGTGVGTAFLVGQNLVLTNYHVVVPPNIEKPECRKFNIKTSDGDTVACKAVLYCENKLIMNVYNTDFCLVEMAALPDGKELGDRYDPLPLYRERLPNNSLQYASRLHPIDHEVTVIGNAGGEGIQAGRGHGISYFASNVMIRHYAPTQGGSSGGPMITNDGLVVGINRGHDHIAPQGSVDCSEKDHNHGASSLYVLEKLKSKIPSEKFKLIRSRFKHRNGMR